MYVYQISELISSLNSAQKDGYEYVEISVLPPENDISESVDFNYIEDANSSESDSFDSILLPDDYVANLKF